MAKAMRAIVLGSGAGGGFPQWNCGCPNCVAVREERPGYVARTQDSIAVGDDRFLLVNASPDLLAQIKAIVTEPDRQGFGPAKLNLGSFYRGDEDFGTLDGLRFESLLGENGQKAGSNFPLPRAATNNSPPLNHRKGEIRQR